MVIIFLYKLVHMFTLFSLLCYRKVRIRFYYVIIYIYRKLHTLLHCKSTFIVSCTKQGYILIHSKFLGMFYFHKSMLSHLVFEPGQLIFTWFHVIFLRIKFSWHDESLSYKTSENMLFIILLRVVDIPMNWFHIADIIMVTIAITSL